MANGEYSVCLGHLLHGFRIVKMHAKGRVHLKPDNLHDLNAVEMKSAIRHASVRLV